MSLSESDDEVYDEEEDEEVMKLAKGFSFSMGQNLHSESEEDEEDSDNDDFVTASTNNRSSKTSMHSQPEVIVEEKKEEMEEANKTAEPVENKRLSLTNLIQEEMDKTTEQLLSNIQPEIVEVKPVSITKSTELKLEVKDTSQQTTGVSPRSPKGQPGVSSLRMKLRSENLANVKDKYVSINLDSLSGIAVADIKRNSLSSTAIVDVEGL